MRILRRLAVAGVAGLTLTGNACAAPPVNPLPVQPNAASSSPTATAGATPSPTATPSRSPAAQPTRTTPRPPPTRPAATASPTERPCYGVIRYDLDLRNTELALLKSMCFAVGAVLRVQGIGPGELTVDPEELVSRSYEAGVVDIRFVRAGTVSVLIPQGGETHTITVVIR